MCAKYFFFSLPLFFNSQTQSKPNRIHIAIWFFSSFFQFNLVLLLYFVFFSFLFSSCHFDELLNVFFLHSKKKLNLTLENFPFEIRDVYTNSGFGQYLMCFFLLDSGYRISNICHLKHTTSYKTYNCLI